MKFVSPLEKVHFVRRYKRFFVDVKRKDNSILTVHCPNPGTMASCIQEGALALISDSGNLKRKLRYTLEMLRYGKTWIGVNTWQANKVIEEAIQEKKIPELKKYNQIQREVKWGDSRIDFLLDQKCYVEVKSVTLIEGKIYRFPDSISKRAQKHILALEEIEKEGKEAVLLFLVQRNDGKIFAPAKDIDLAYTKLLQSAYDKGLKILAYEAKLGELGIEVKKSVRIDLWA